MNKNKYFILFYFCMISVFSYTRLHCQNNVEFTPEDEQQLRDEYKKMFGEDIKDDELAEFKKIVSSVSTELEKQEQKSALPNLPPAEPTTQPLNIPEYQQPESFPVPTIIEKPISTKPKDKRTCFLESWAPKPPKQQSDTGKSQKEEKDKLPKEKLEAFNFYTNKFSSLLNQTKSQISSLHTQKREKFKIYEKDLNEILATINTIQSKKTYRISFFNEKSRPLRAKILELIEELELIMQDLNIHQTTTEIGVPDKSEHEEILKEIAVKKDSGEISPLKIVKPQQIKPAYEQKAPTKSIKKDIPILPVPKKVVKEINLSWYEKAWVKIKNITLESWDFIKKVTLKLFKKPQPQSIGQTQIEESKSKSGPKAINEPENVKLAANDFPSPIQKNDHDFVLSPKPLANPELKSKTKISPTETKPLIIGMPKTKESLTQPISLPLTTPKKTKVATDNITKMALKRLQKVLSNNLAKLNIDLKEVIKASEVRIGEKQKEQTEKVRKADELKKQRDSSSKGTYYPKTAGSGSYSGNTPYYSPYYDPYMGSSSYGGGSYGGGNYGSNNYGGSGGYSTPSTSSSEFSPSDKGYNATSTPEKDTDLLDTDKEKIDKEKKEKNNLWGSKSDKDIPTLIEKEQKLKKKFIDEVAELEQITQDPTKNATVIASKIDVIQKLQSKADDASLEIPSDRRKDDSSSIALDQKYQQAVATFDKICQTQGIQNPNAPDIKSSKPKKDYLEKTIELKNDLITQSNIGLSLIESCTTQLATTLTSLDAALDKGLRANISEITKKYFKILDVDKKLGTQKNSPEFLTTDAVYQQKLKEFDDGINILNIALTTPPIRGGAVAIPRGIPFNKIK